MEAISTAADLVGPSEARLFNATSNARILILYLARISAKM